MVGWWRWRWALVSPDGVAPSRVVGVPASVNLPLNHKIQKFSSGTGSPGWSRKKGHKTVVVVPCVKIGVNWFGTWLLLSDGGHGDSDETDTKTSADNDDDDDDYADDSRVDDDEDDNEDYVKEFEAGETCQLHLISCEYGMSIIYIVVYEFVGNFENCVIIFSELLKMHTYSVIIVV